MLPSDVPIRYVERNTAGVATQSFELFGDSPLLDKIFDGFFEDGGEPSWKEWRQEGL